DYRKNVSTTKLRGTSGRQFVARSAGEFAALRLFRCAGETMRRHLKPTIILAVLGLVLGALYRYLFDRPDEADFANYLRSSLHAAGISLAGWAVHLYFTSRSSAWVRRLPLFVELIIRSVAMAVVVATVTVALEAIIYPHGVDDHWLVSDYPFIVAIAF